MEDDDADDEKAASEAQVVTRILAENDLDAEHVLVLLLQTLVDRYVACKLRPELGAGGRPQGPSVLEQMMYLLQLDRQGNLKTFNPQAGETSDSEEEPEDDIIGADRANVQASLFEMLVNCLQMAEKRAGVEDDDEPPKMRLVRD